MNSVVRSYLRITVFSLGLLCALSPLLQAQRKPVTLKDVFRSSDFRASNAPGFQWLKDGTSYSTMETTSSPKGQVIVRVHATDGTRDTVLNTAVQPVPTAGNVTFDSYRWSPTGRYLLLQYEREMIWRRSYTASYLLFDTQRSSFLQLPQEVRGVRNFKLSPDETLAGYVKDDNLWICELGTGSLRQLTDDAGATTYNGRFGWVYEEEFGITDGWRWSPDSKSIAFWQEDEGQVPVVTLTDWMPLHFSSVPIRYPKPGDANPVERIGVIDVDDGDITWMDTGEDTDIYLPRLHWTRDSRHVLIYRLNRLQNELELLKSDVRSGASAVLLRETSESGWVEVEDNVQMTLLDTQDRFIWASERDGWRHLYLYDYDGKLLRELTSGSFEVTAVEGVSPDETKLYFMSTEESPLERHLYRVPLQGGSRSRLTPDAGWHRVSMNDACTMYRDDWSSVTSPTRRALFTVDGKEIEEFGRIDTAAIGQWAWSERKLIRVIAQDGSYLDASIMLPPDFDPQKQYPVYFDVYGGPGTQQIMNSWPSAMHQWIVNEGFIHFQLDNRGSGGRGTAFKHSVYKKLCQNEVEDYVAGAQYLSSLPYVDASRIGIWGWSYGGTMAAMTLLRAPEYFSVAVSIAPVTDWRFYDTIYTERFMQRPEDNETGYEKGSCLTYADRLEGRLLLVHGGMDDNVHMQNTMHLVDKLTSAGKQFDMRLYPRGDHGVASNMASRLGLFEYFMQFMKEHLQ